MSCGCDKGTQKPISRDRRTVKIEKLYKPLKASQCSLKDKEEVYPQTLLQAVFDGYTGARLDRLLTMCNFIYLPWQGRLRDTLKKIPRGLRRQGLIITTVDGAGNVINKQYTGSCSSDCQDITNPQNWVDINQRPDVFYRPKGLRIEGDTIFFDYVDHKGKNRTLQSEIGMFHIEVTDKSILDNPSKAKPNVIYLVPNELAPGTFREYVRYTRIVNGIEEHRLEQLGSASGVCGKLAKPDRSLKDSVYTDGKLKLRVGYSPDVDPEGKLDEIIEVPIETSGRELDALKERVRDLERKEDKDTIFDPSAIFSTIKDLADSLKEAKESLAELKAKQDNHVVSGKWINDDTIEITMSDGSKVNITKDKVETWRELPAKKIMDAPLPVEWDQEPDMSIFEGEESVVRTAVLGYRTVIEEEKLINGKPTGEKRIKSDVHTPGAPELRRRGVKHRPVVTTRDMEEVEVIHAGPNEPDHMDSNLYEGNVVTVGPVDGERRRIVTYTLIDGVVQPNPKYGEWRITKNPTAGYRVLGTKKKPVERTYTVYYGKYPHFSGIGDSGHPITAEDIKKLSMFVAKQPSEVFKEVIAVSHENSRFSYAYPKELGPVSKIIDGSNDNIRENFDENVITIDGIEYLVYTIAGAFGSTRVRQEIPFTFVK